MKPIKHILLLAALLLCSLSVSAHDFEVEGIYYSFTSEEDQTVAVTYRKSPGLSSYTGAVAIPSMVTYKGMEYRVISIGNAAFSGCRSLTAITIPESVTSIGDDAFSDCRSLTAITIPESVASIGNYAFSGCSSLTAITLPESVTSIGNYAFSGCSSLTSITIPEGVTSIESSAFSGCSSLTSITLPESVTSIESSAFSGCSSLTSITIPEGVTSIESSAFSGCSSFERVTINCANVGDWFSGFSSIKEIVLGEGVTSIGSSAFKDCSSLTAITISESVTNIGNHAFSGCSSLTAIKIPKSVTSIGDRDNIGFSCGVFDDCTSLKEVVFEDGSETLAVGCNVCNIGPRHQGLFYDCPLEKVYLGRNLSYCGTQQKRGVYSPFYEKGTLTSLTIGPEVTEIGKNKGRRMVFKGWNRLLNASGSLCCFLFRKSSKLF